MALADFFITEEDVLQGLDLQKPELEQIISAIERQLCRPSKILKLDHHRLRYNAFNDVKHR